MVTLDVLLNNKPQLGLQDGDDNSEEKVTPDTL